MQLQDFDKYENICIQCHDNPDADTIASGYALYIYFKEHGKQVRLIYSGRFQIHKINLILMLERLFIPIQYVAPADISLTDELLITVDCQYSAGNVTLIPAEHIAVIDHHQIEIESLDNALIMSNFGSCSTIIWQLLTEAGFDFSSHPNVSTALYYGLFTDTQQFAEIYNPADKDMRDSLRFTQSIINLLRNSNLSARELEIAGIAMIRAIHNDTNRYSLIKAQPCDPNILGLISDMCIQVDDVDMCVVYNELDDGIKFSVRSCIKETKASDLAIYLANSIGSGGGHLEKAGGFISRRKYEKAHPGYHTEAYFSERIQQYCYSFDIIHAKTYDLDTSGMPCYKKRHFPIGYVIPEEFLAIGTPITVRTLEGDIDTSVSKDMVIMIGRQGEVYPHTKEKFARSYTACDIPYNFNVPYKPTIKNLINGSILSLERYVKSCISSRDTYIYAHPLKKSVKVFTEWNADKYMLGHIDDYIAVGSDDPHDIYIIEKNIFYTTYEECKEP